MIRFRYLFHGTSSISRRNIQENGLRPRNGVLHLTTHPFVALLEAQRTVCGEEGFRGAYKPGVGGIPVLVKIERAAVKKLRIDPEWYDKGEAIGRRLVQVRGEFSTDIAISPENLSFIQFDVAEVCRQLMKEINGMTRLPPLERRFERRFLCSEIVSVSWATDDVRHENHANLEDLSPSGCKLLMEGAVAECAAVEIRIRDHMFRGAVRYCRSTEIGFDIGIQFLQPQAWNRQEFEPEHLFDPRTLKPKSE